MSDFLNPDKLAELVLESDVGLMDCGSGPLLQPRGQSGVWEGRGGLKPSLVDNAAATFTSMSSSVLRMRLASSMETSSARSS